LAIVEICKNKNKIKKKVLWFAPIPSPCAINIMSWTIIFTEFLTFNLLIIFFASIINGSQWEEEVSLICRDTTTSENKSNSFLSLFQFKRKTLYFFVYFFVAFIALVIITTYNTVICVIENDEEQANLRDDLILYFGRIPPGTVFIILLVLLLFYGIRLLIAMKRNVFFNFFNSKKKISPLYLSSINIYSIAIVIVVNSVVLSLRILTAFVPLVEHNFSKDFFNLSCLRQHAWGSIMVICLYILYETLPISSLLIIFGKIPTNFTKKVFTKEPVHEQSAVSRETSFHRNFSSFRNNENEEGAEDNFAFTQTPTESPSSVFTSSPVFAKFTKDSKNSLLFSSKYNIYGTDDNSTN
jgi:hypothetical protein